MNPFQLPVKVKTSSKGSDAQTLVILYYSDDEGKSFRSEISKTSSELASRIAQEPENGALKGGMDEMAWFQTSKQNILIGSGGSHERKDLLAIRMRSEKLMRTAIARGSESVAFQFIGASKEELEVAVEGAIVGQYSYDTTKSKKSERKTVELSIVTDQLNDDRVHALRIMAEGTVAARELAIRPANEATPVKIVEQVREWTQGLGLEIEVYDRAKASKKGMGLFVSVSQGGVNEPQMLVLRYRPQGGAKGGKTLGLIGKGVTFDTGGYNLKTVPYKDLIDMKSDMGGAAAVIGAMISIARLKPATPVIGICGLTENMISGQATRPGDVYKSLLGKTVEIQNTDAEGRLVLADALALAREEGATHLVDIATLTGACVIALGGYYTGLMTNNPEWAASVRKVAGSRGEPTWDLPLNFRHADEMKSDVADLSNMGKGRSAGASLAGIFLAQFAEKTPWVHCDIAGSADYTDNGGIHGTARYSGVMASTLAQLAIDVAS